MFDTEPLCLFEAAFDVDMMVAYCSTSHEWKRFGKDGFKKLRSHFSDVFSREEFDNMESEYKL